MATNVGGADKAIRIVLGLTLVLSGIFHVITGNWVIAAYVVGAIALVTGLFGFCPAWAIFKVNTRSAGHAHSK
jgi:Inner membrane protein YgaP-like, transmembrane domain